MPDKDYFELLIQSVGRCETRFQKYVVPPLLPKRKSECICKDEDSNNQKEIKLPPDILEKLNEGKDETEILEQNLRMVKACENFEALTDFVNFETPKVVIWHYMTKKELENFLTINDHKIREKIIEKKLGPDFIKGTCRIMIVKLIDDVTEFCKSQELPLEATGSVLSIFYLTHRYFTASLYRTALETYNYFKEFLFCISISCPPECIKLIEAPKSKEILNFFCRIYLKNLPLIRLLCCPNYGFFVDYHVEVDELEQMIKETKAKTQKGKGKKGKDDKKKGGKKK